MEWTFPVMSAPPAEDDPSLDPGRFETLKAPLVGGGTAPSETIRPISIGEPGDSRPSTSGSQGSDFSFAPSSEADYDPFRLDRPTSPTSASHQAHQAHQAPPNFTDTDFPEIIDSADEDTYSRPSSVIKEGPGPDDRASSILDLDGPGPDEEDEIDDGTTTTTTTWNDSIIAGPPSSHRISVSDPEPFPTAFPSREFPGDVPDSPLPDVLPTIQYRPHSISRHGTEDEVQFPDPAPPSVESLMAGAEEGVLMGELDRLLGDFLDALSATGEALGKTRAGSGSGTGTGGGSGPGPETVEVRVGGSEGE